MRMRPARPRRADGIHTYVFKGGVVYRGALKAGESGAAGNPIRLTRDPDWGKGEAAIYGSTQIKGGWKKASAAEAPGIPQPDKVWYIDLGKDYDPDPVGAKFSAMWQVDGDKVERLHIAREPNYDFSDPNNPVKNWPTWSGYDAKTTDVDVARSQGPWRQRPVSQRHDLDRARFPDGGGHGALDGELGLQPRCRLFDEQRSESPARSAVFHDAKVHFMIENVAKFLDAPGEYFFAVNGPKAGRLFLWPARRRRSQ